MPGAENKELAAPRCTFPLPVQSAIGAVLSRPRAPVSVWPEGRVLVATAHLSCLCVQWLRAGGVEAPSAPQRLAHAAKQDPRPGPSWSRMSSTPLGTLLALLSGPKFVGFSRADLLSPRLPLRLVSLRCRAVGLRRD